MEEKMNNQGNGIKRLFSVAGKVVGATAALALIGAMGAVASDKLMDAPAEIKEIVHPSDKLVLKPRFLGKRWDVYNETAKKWVK